MLVQMVEARGGMIRNNHAHIEFCTDALKGLGEQEEDVQARAPQDQRFRCRIHK